MSILSLKTIAESIILEQKENYQLYIDLDGVLVDFPNGFEKWMRRYETPEDVQKEIGKETITYMDLNNRENRETRQFAYKIISKDDQKFWPNLSWMPDGKELWNYVKQLDPIILTSTIGKSEGKYIWAKKNLNLSRDRIILERDKSKYARFNDKIGILIDDSPKKLTPFEEKGGIAIYHENAKKTIKRLHKLGF